MSQDRVCDIIIPVYDRLELTRACLTSIYERTRKPFGLILIDNGSGRETIEFLKAQTADVTVIRNPDNLGWVKAVNQGLKASKSPYVVLMNNDTVVRTDDWLSELIEIAGSEADIGLVNPYFKAKDRPGAGRRYIEVDFCRGYCVLVKRGLIERIGLLDESYGLGYYDDDDYSVRAINAGFRCVRANTVFVEHLGDSTFSEIFKDAKRLELHEKNKRLFYAKWGKRLKILFILKRAPAKDSLDKLFFSLARRQHIVYLWNFDKPLGLPHINIRERALSPFFRALAPMALYFNRTRSASKRYDIVFIDDKLLGSRLSGSGHQAYCLDTRDDFAESVRRMVDSLARGKG